MKPVRKLLFSVVTFSPYGLFYCWFVAGKEPPTTVVVTPTPTEIVPYKIPTGIIDYVLANHYTGEGHPEEHLLYLSNVLYLSLQV